MTARVFTTSSTLTVHQQGIQVASIDGTMMHGEEVLVSDSYIKISSVGGKVTGVELLNTGTWDKIEKAVDNRHKMDSMMVAQYARECPKGFKVEDIPDTKYRKVTMTDFKELFELEQTVRAGELLVKVVGKFAPKEKRKDGVHFTLRFEFDDGGIMMVPFYSKRATLMERQKPRRELKRAFDEFLKQNPSVEQIQGLKRCMVAHTQLICAEKEQHQQQ